MINKLDARGFIDEVMGKECFSKSLGAELYEAEANDAATLVMEPITGGRGIHDDVFLELDAEEISGMILEELKKKPQGLSHSIPLTQGQRHPQQRLAGRRC